MQFGRQLTVLSLVGLLVACASDEGAREEGAVFKSFIGGVTADEPRAALEGRRVLAEGGSAADAATAVYFSLAVTLPSAASLGGGGICLAFDREQERVEVLDFLSRPPTQTMANMSRPSAVPGNVRGFSALHSRFGHLPWPRVVSPGERLARFGTPVSRALARELASVSSALLEDSEARRIFGKSGGVLAEGDWLQQRDLSAVLSRIRARGPIELYRGRFAKTLVDGIAVAGGAVTLSELRDYRPRWLPTVRYSFGNFVRRLIVHVPPPPVAGGIAAGQIVAMIQSIGSFGGASEFERQHILAETSLRAFGKRAAWRGVDLQSRVPAGRLLADDRISRLLANFDPGKHILPNPFNPSPIFRTANPSSTGFVVADRNGNAVVCALTMNGVFGTGRVVRGTGIVLASRPSSELHRRLPLSPVLLLNQNTDQMFFAGVATGGTPAPTALATVLARTLFAEQPIREAIQIPRVHHGGAPDITFYEPTLNAAILSELIARGHRLTAVPVLGRVNAISCPAGLPRVPDSCGVGVDPRGHGLALSALE